MLLLILFLPLFGSVAAGLFGFFIGQIGSMIITTFATFLSFLFSLILLYNSIILNHEFYLYISTWIKSDLFHCHWSFLFDRLTMIMLITITSISTLVHVYGFSYMSADPHLSRFMSYLSLFTFFMILLVTADNFILMFFGWEGVGVCSFLLINFWFTRLQANKAAIKAMLVNRISDLSLLLGIITIYFFTRSVDYSTVFSLINTLQEHTFYFLAYKQNIIDTICFLLFIGAMGKSAQIFLHIWLPDAMEGPTPVSALIHAATMVTAGIYLIVRCSHIFEYSPKILTLMAIIGASTAFFASTVALVQNDIKKIIAYSTCSQLGYMFIACGLSNYPAAMFHLSNHAYFKALLFLCSGAVIHAMNDEQDIRKMGALKRILPFTYSMFLIGSFSLIGFPFLNGFYSKDFILEQAFATFHHTGHFAYWLGTVGAFLTAFYSTRLIFFVFLSETNAYRKIIQQSHDVSLQMGLVLGLLAFGSIFIGYLTKDLFIGLGTTFWNNTIFIHFQHNQIIDAEFIPFFFKSLPVFFSFLGLWCAVYLYFFEFHFLYKLKISKKGLQIYNFLNKKWFFEKIYYEWINQLIIQKGYDVTYKQIDKGLIEMFGPYSWIHFFSFLSRRITFFQTGYLFHYSLIMLISVLSFILILFIF